MDPLSLLLIGVFSLFVTHFVNQGERERAKQDALDLQHDAQAHNSEEAELNRKFQEEFYNKYTSPSALFDQFKSVGASDNAALMSALGVSPSVASGATASTGAASGLGAGVNGTSDLLNSVFSSLQNYMDAGLKGSQKEGQDIENAWKPAINDSMIKASLGQLQINKDKLHLDKLTYENVTVPLANASLNKTSADIAEINKRMDVYDQEILKMQEEINLMGTQENLNIANTGESLARTGLTLAETGKVGAETENIEEDTHAKQFENRILKLSTEASEFLGFDVRLDWHTNTFYEANKVIKTGVEAGKEAWQNHKSTIKANGVPWEDFSRGVRTTTNALEKGLRYKEIGKKAFDSTFDFMDKSQRHSLYWRKHRDKHYKDAQDWYRRNVVYQ